MNNKRSFFKRKLKIGLALGGGGARGFTHIGVIKAFEEQGIEFDFIAATSAGALVGAMYAAGFSAQEMIDKTADFDIKDIKTSKIPLMPHKTEALQNVIKQTIGDLQFSDLKKPFCSVAVDVRTGEEIHLIKGNLAPAVAASCAVPGVFLPVEIDDYLLMDGGLLNNIPSSVPKLFGCDIVISVDINSSRGAGTKSSKYLDIVLSSIQIMMKSNSLKGYVDADVMIAPDTKRFRSTKIVSKEEMIEEGYKAANEKINDIKRIVGMKILKDPNVKKLYEEHQKKKRIRNFFRKNSVSTTNLAEEDIIEISHEIEKQTEATKDKIKIKNKKKKKD